MAVDLKALMNKNKPATPEPAAPVTPAVEVKTGSAPTKPKLAFTLGNRAVTAPIPEAAPIQQIEEERSQALAVQTEIEQAEQENPYAQFVVKPAEPQVEDMPGFEDVLKEIDGLFVEGTGYTQLTIDLARTRIVRVMKELHGNSELMSLVKDTDIRNIMAFINYSADSARKTLAEKGEKKETKEKKTTRRRSLDMSGFGAELSANLTQKPLAKDLQSLAKLDLSQIALPKK